MLSKSSTSKINKEKISIHIIRNLGILYLRERQTMKTTNNLSTKIQNFGGNVQL